MTTKEKAVCIEEYCNSRRLNKQSCDMTCPLFNISKNTCYNAYERFPIEIDRNYKILFDDVYSSEEPVKDDNVNHPSHYTAGGVECIDAIAAAICKYESPVDAWLAGQVIKYLWRAPLKGKYKEDLEKAQFYLNRLVGRQGESR